jgi:DNA repair protein RadC
MPNSSIASRPIGPLALEFPGAANAPAHRRRARRRDGWPARDMPRERLLAAGPAALSDAELIAIFLGSGLRGHNVFDVARSLLARFGSLRTMLDATPADFKGLRGIGPAKIAVLLAVVEMARRALAEKAREKPLVDSPGAVEDYLRLLIGARPHEVFVCLFLDARHRLLHVEESSRGSLTRMAVYPREIVRQALTLNAAGLIVAHNHPSGAAKPSASDRRLTRVLRDSLALIDVRLMDHLVVGGDTVFSLAKAGWL